MRFLVTKQRYISLLEEIKKSGGKVDSGEPNDFGFTYRWIEHFY